MKRDRREPVLQSRAMPLERPSSRPNDVGDIVEVMAPAYSWRWSPATDEFVLSDEQGRTILSSPLQPAVEATQRRSPGPGHCVGHKIDGARLRVRYAGVNGIDELEMVLRFDATHFVIEQTTFTPADDSAVVRVAWLASWEDGVMRPAGAADTCVIPGGRQDPEQAIFATANLEDHRFSVGAFGLDLGTYHQQWALPHYLVVAYNSGDAPSGAACIGLGAAPDGNVLVRVHRGRFSYETNVRGDLWGHRARSRRGPVRRSVGCRRSPELVRRRSGLLRSAARRGLRAATPRRGRARRRLPAPVRHVGRPRDRAAATTSTSTRSTFERSTATFAHPACGRSFS